MGTRRSSYFSHFVLSETFEALTLFVCTCRYLLEVAEKVILSALSYDHSSSYNWYHVTVPPAQGSPHKCDWAYAADDCLFLLRAGARHFELVDLLCTE